MSNNPSGMRSLSWERFPNVEATINALVECARRQKPISSATVKVNETTSGTSFDVVFPSQKPMAAPFEVSTYGLDVSCAAGRVFRHEADYDVAALASTSVSPSSTTYIWVEIDDEFAATPAFSIESGTALPTNSNSPARKYLKLATITSSASACSVEVAHEGNIFWPPVFGFWK